MSIATAKAALVAMTAAGVAVGCARSPEHPCRSHVECAVGWSCVDGFCRPGSSHDASAHDASGPDTKVRDANGSDPATDTATFDTAGGDSPSDSGPSVVPTSPWNFMFVTSGLHLADFQTLENADNICKATAAAANLPGSYRAWLSTTQVDARDRLAGARGWVRVDGAPFADSIGDLANGYLLSAPQVDEHGRHLDPRNIESSVNTGTFRDGALMAFDNCSDWKSSSGTAQVGTFAATTRLWTEFASLSCGSPARLYCFGVDKYAPLAPPPVSGRRAFVSHSSFGIGGGLAAADAVCARDAAAVGLPPTFKALLPTETSSAASRFPGTSTTVWTRLDGIPLNAPGAFFGGLLLAPLNLTSHKAYVSFPNVLTGARTLQEVPAPGTTCSDWSDPTTGSAFVGSAASVTGWWFDAIAGSCDYPFHRSVYCLEADSPPGDAGVSPADAGSNPDPPPPAVNNYIFATALTFPPTKLTPEFGDAACAGAAASARLAGTFRAWLSSPQVDARDRLSGARGWIRTDGLPFADTLQDLIAGRIFYPPDLDEYGVQRRGDQMVPVVTNTRVDGTRDPDRNCVDIPSSRQPGVRVGYSDGSTEAWTSGNTETCLGRIGGRIYCLGVDKSAPLTPTPVHGNLAFLSDGTFMPGGGIQAADALCDSEATTAGLPRRFKALLATSSSSAAARFSSPGTTVWGRLDGIPISLGDVDLFKGGPLRAPLNVTSKGRYVGYAYAATGASSVDALPTTATTCNDWRSTGGPQMNLIGITSVTSLFFGALTTACDTAAHLYCLED